MCTCRRQTGNRHQCLKLIKQEQQKKEQAARPAKSYPGGLTADLLERVVGLLTAEQMAVAAQASRAFEFAVREAVRSRVRGLGLATGVTRALVTAAATTRWRRTAILCY